MIAEQQFSCVRYFESLVDRGLLDTDGTDVIPDPDLHVNEKISLRSKGRCLRKRKHDPATILEALDWIERQSSKQGAVKAAAERFGIPRPTLIYYRSSGSKHVPLLRKEAFSTQS